MRDIDLTCYNHKIVYYKNLSFKNIFMSAFLKLCSAANIKIKPSDYLFSINFTKYSHRLNLDDKQYFEIHGIYPSNFRYALKENIHHWLEKNMKHKCIQHTRALYPRGSIYFSNIDDYMLFKLTWGGKNA